MFLVSAVLYFLLWTFVLYWIHRVCHGIPILRNIHLDHHAFVNKNTPKWAWNNLLLFNDTPKSTADLWITEVIPTFIFSFITGQWWIFIFYYLWASLIQERIEHSKSFDLPVLTSGKWHLIHHRTNKNYGLFLPIWDILFGSYKGL